jgi:steroid 5-alpha reductase family enzyme
VSYPQLLAVTIGYSTLWFIIAQWLKRNDVADVAWGMGFVLLAWLSFLASTWSAKSLLVTGLVTLWGMRLSIHLFLRVKSSTEDFRYRTWREQWKHVALRSYLQVFLLQACLLFVVALPVIHINKTSPEFSPSDLAGVLLWAVGFAVQTLSDAQLKKFKSNPAKRGKLLTTGVWRISRHPNYLGEALMWWGIYLLAAPDWNNAWWLVISPVLITYLLRYVSGVPLLEKKYEGRPDFEAYKASTPVFFPCKLFLRKP